MNGLTPLCHITCQVQQHLSALSVPLQNVLSHLTYALLQAKDVRQNHLAQSAPPNTKPDSFERRFQRFLANPRIPLEATQEQWAKWVLRELSTDLAPLADAAKVAGASPAEVVLLVDETSLAEHVRVMALCLAYQGRAIPLCWESYEMGSPRCQVQVITTLLQRVHQAMPAMLAGHPIVVQADRGIGCSPALLKAISDLGWYYLVRVQKTVRLRFPVSDVRGETTGETPGETGNTPENRGSEVPFSSLLACEGDHLPLCFGQAFKKAGWLDCGILGCFTSGHQDAWCLLTNYPKATCRGYALRMWVEACFRDLKSNGWQWQRSRVRSPAKVGRLWLVMALSLVFALSLGTQVAQEAALRREVARGKARRQSVFVLGLRLFAAILRGRVACERVLWQRWVLLPELPSDAFNDAEKTVV